MSVAYRLREHIQDREDQSISPLFEILKQPSVSSTGEGMERCAELVSHLMAESGLSAEIHATGGWPVVFGELIQDPDAPTVLIYGHYDVQPVGELELWDSPPYEPTIRDGRIFARGSADNKGQFVAHLQAVRFLREIDRLPFVNIKMLLEGEEEIASPHLREYIESHRTELAAEVVYSSDGPMDLSGKPTVSLGCRGILHIELEKQGANRDVHSGQFGGVVGNPALILVSLLASMQDEDGRVRIAGFYDDVREVEEVEAQILESTKVDPNAVSKELGLEPGLDLEPAELGLRLMFRPNMNIAGIYSGHAGNGVKTIIPSRAIAKMDVRLVVDQDPEVVFRLIEDYVQSHDPSIRVRSTGVVPPSRTSVDEPMAQTVISAIRDALSEEPVIELCKGGTVPDYLFTSVLDLPSIWVPYANHDSANHAPNENLRLDCFFRGIISTAAVLERIAQRAGAPAGGGPDSHEESEGAMSQ